MILKIFLFCFLSAILGSNVDALSCNQGQYVYGDNMSAPLAQCPTDAYSCTLSFDAANMNRLAKVAACQRTNCTIPGSYNISSSDFCQNITSFFPPYTFCCCYGDGCNGKLLTKLFTYNPPSYLTLPYNYNANASVCSPRGAWGIWSDWSECPNSADPIFELLSDINMQTRIRDCLPQPSGCIRTGTTFMCDGQHWEQRPCGKRPSGNGTANTNFMPPGFLTMPNGSG